MEGRTEAQLLREARIRRGTSAPGPKPSGSGGRPELLPGTGETLDRLAGDYCLFQLRNGHRYSTDDLLCAAFACEAVEALGLTVREGLDLGSGIGSVLLLLAWRLPQARLLGLEAQEVSVALAGRSIRWNGVEARVRIRQGDLRQVQDIEAEAFDLVTGTPPYFDQNRGSISLLPQRGPCRFEVRGGVEAYLEAAARALRPGGVAVLVQTWKDLERIRHSAREHGLTPVLSQAVQFKQGRAPALCLHAFAHAGTEHELPALVVRRVDGSHSEEFRALRLKMGYPLERGFEGAQETPAASG